PSTLVDYDCMTINATVAAPAMLLLEVMDKEPTLAQRTALYGVLTLIGVLLATKRWWLGLIVLPIAALFAVADLSELRDPYVGPEIIKEAGVFYVVVWYSLILASVAIPSITAVILRRRKSS